MCDQFWCIEVRMEYGETLASVMRYAPGETPYEGTEITLNPGQKYTREFQLDAYVDIPSYVTVYGHNDTTASVIVHYDPEPTVFKQWTAAPRLRFSSTAIALQL